MEFIRCFIFLSGFYLLFYYSIFSGKMLLWLKEKKNLDLQMSYEFVDEVKNLFMEKDEF